jgi:predicted transport protein
MIFESMNSTGKALTQADLIRNFVLMGLEHDLQTRLYTDYWQPMEVEFGAESYISQFDEFMRYFLVIHTGNVRIRRGDVYDEFKAYSRKHEVEALLGSLKEFAGYFCCIALGTEKEKTLAEAFHDIRELRADVCYPMLMELYQDFCHARITLTEFRTVVRMVESYVFRRATCDIPTNSLRQTLATFMRQVKKDRYVESVKAVFLMLPSYRRFPGDDEFIRLIQTRNLYKFNRRSYWLRRFENHGRKERVQVQDYTIEHIMPQNESLNLQWQADLGEDWKRIHGQYLHTLGNLTLTGYNSEYSDRAFAEKRDMEDEFKDSPLRVNKGLGLWEVWNESSIKQRAQNLAEAAAKIWTAPNLPEDILDAYQPVHPVGASYTIADHLHLQGGLSRKLFDAFRVALLALDECVTEEYLKLYVAYKAETNFVDVVPQAQCLRLSLNLKFPEIDDPRGICRDVTNLGRWGNGNVEVRLDDQADITYIIGLIRQALEKQLGEDD